MATLGGTFAGHPSSLRGTFFRLHIALAEEGTLDIVSLMNIVLFRLKLRAGDRDLNFDDDDFHVQVRDIQVKTLSMFVYAHLS